MKKTNWIKKILSFVLAIVMVAGMINMPAKAAENYSGSLSIEGTGWFATQNTTNTSFYVQGTDTYLSNEGEDWVNNARKMQAADADSGVFIGTVKQANGMLNKIIGTSGGFTNIYQITGIEANTGDVITVKGTFTTLDGAAQITFAESKFKWTGSTWEDYVEIAAYESRLLLDGTGWYGTNANNTNTALYVHGTDAYLPEAGEAWSGDDRTLIADNAGSGVFFGEERQENASIMKLIGGVETAGATHIYYISGMEASEGTVLTVKGTFTTKDGAARITFAESKFKWTGSTWEAYVEIAAYESRLLLDGTGWYGTNANNTNTALYVHGTDAYLPEAGEAWSGDDRTLIADNADSGVFFGEARQENASIMKLVGGLVGAAGATHIYYISGIEASEGTVLTVKGTFTTKDGAAQITFAESKFKWTGSTWEDYVEIAAYESRLLLDGTGWYGTNANNTNTALYVHGTDTYLPEAGEAWSGDDRTLIADNADSGVFFGEERQENASIMKLVGGLVGDAGATHIYYISGIEASEGTVLTVKGTFTTKDDAARITFAESKFKWTGSAWEHIYTGLVDTGVQYDVNSDRSVDTRDLVRMLRHIDDSTVPVNDSQKDINCSGIFDEDDIDSFKKVLLGMISYVDGKVYGTPVYNDSRVIEKMAYVCPAVGTWNTENTEFTPLSNAELDSILQKYKAAGLTLLNTENVAPYHDNDWNAEVNEPIRVYLEAAKRNDLGVLVFDNVIQYMLTQKNPAVYGANWQGVIESHIQTLQNYSSFRGFVIWDEMTIEYVDTYNQIVSYIRESHPELLLVTSLLPVTVYDQTGDNKGVGALTTNASASKEEAYRDYIWSYAEKTGHFIYDLYPLVYSEDKIFGYTYKSQYGVVDDWYLNLQCVANEVKEHNYSFTTGVTIQACKLTGWSNSKASYETYAPEKPEDIGFQVYTAMAYGMKNINYFTYADHWNDTIVEGSMTEHPLVYDAVSAVNAEIDKFANVYQSFLWKDTLDVAVGETNNSTGNDRLSSVTAANARTFVGCMKDTDGFDGYMVANASGPREGTSAEVTLKFKDADSAIVYIDGVKRTVELVDGAYTVTVPSGEGVFVIPLRAR